MAATMSPKLLLSIVLVLGALQSSIAEPRPDFGIKATVSGSAIVLKATKTVNDVFDAIDDLDIPLTNGYTLLNNMKTALLYIGSHVATSGKALTGAITTLIGDRSNDVPTAFGPVYSAIGTLRTLLQSGFTTQFTTLQAQGTTITDLFTSGFRLVLNDLSALSDALDRMKAGVLAAKNANGNPPNGISADNLNRYVPPKLTQDIRDALGLIGGDAPFTKNLINLVQRRLSTADAFVGEMYAEAQQVIGDVTRAKDLLTTYTDTMGTDIGSSLQTNVGPVYDAQLLAIGNIQSTIEAMSTYALDLQPALEELSNVLNATATDGFAESIDTVFDGYDTDLTAALSSSVSADVFFGTETCAGLRTVIDALVATKPYSSDCFDKFSPQLFVQFALAYYTISECYDIETVRLTRMQDLMATIVTMVMYDVEDLGEAIASCAPLTGGASCLTMIGPYYEILATTIADKQTYMVDFIENELYFSVQRLGMCVSAAKYTMTISVAAAVSPLTACLVNGLG